MAVCRSGIVLPKHSMISMPRSSPGQSFFSGSDFAELHASIESLGHMSGQHGRVGASSPGWGEDDGLSFNIHNIYIGHYWSMF